MRTPILTRIWQKIVVKDSCWEWTGTKNRTIRVGGRGEAEINVVHRMWKEVNGQEFPRGYYAHHTCGNRNCINPDHIRLSKSPIQRQDRNKYFWDRVEKRDQYSCWLWKGTIYSSGYGVAKIGRTRMLAHRLSYELLRGPIDDGLFVCHTCDNPSCVNPSHLFLGTLQDNVDDMMVKERNVRGRNVNTCKLTEDDVLEIRKLAGNLSTKELANRFGVSDTTIWQIANRKSWKWL
jgi:hypothetical protein